MVRTYRYNPSITSVAFGGEDFGRQPTPPPPHRSNHPSNRINGYSKPPCNPSNGHKTPSNRSNGNKTPSNHSNGFSLSNSNYKRKESDLPKKLPSAEESFRLLQKLQRDYTELLQSVNLEEIRKEQARIHSSDNGRGPVRSLSRHSLAHRSNSVPSPLKAFRRQSGDSNRGQSAEKTRQHEGSLKRNSSRLPTWVYSDLEDVEDSYFEETAAEMSYSKNNRERVVIPYEEAKTVEGVGGGFGDPVELERRMKMQEKERANEYRLQLESQMSRQKANRQHSSYQQRQVSQNMEVDRMIKQTERQRNQEYQRQLQAQMEEQRNARLHSAIDFGGSTRQELLRQKQSSSPRGEWGGLPGLGGNSQPKNGIRGSQAWNRQASSSQHQGALRQSSLPSSFQQHGYALPGTTMPLTSTFTPLTSSFTPLSSPYDPFSAALSHRQQADHKTIVARQLQEAQLQSQRQKLEHQRKREEEDYDPFGRGGGGAPIKNRNGILVSDRRRMAGPPQNSGSVPYANGTGLNGDVGFDLHQSLFGNPPPLSQPTQILNSGVQLSEKDRNKLELLEQIEERKRAREIEKARQKAEDEMDRRRIEAEQEKMRREAEEERLRQQAKLEAKLQKSNGVSEKQQDFSKKNEEKANRRANKSQNDADDGLEWWEKAANKNNNNRRSSAVNNRAQTPTTETPGTSKPKTPTHRQQPSSVPPPANATYDSVQTLQEDSPPPMRRRGGSEGEGGGRKYAPRSAAVRNEGVMRQMSAMRERLTKEQIRVKSALGRKEYNNELFSDEEFPTEYVYRDENQSPSLMRRKKQIVSLDDLDEPPSLMHRKDRRKPSLDEDFPSYGRGRRGLATSNGHEGEDLVSLIKNSQTRLGSASSTRPRSRAPRNKKLMKGFLSDSEDDVDVAASRSRGRRKSSPVEGDNPDSVLNGYLKNRGASRRQASPLGY